VFYKDGAVCLPAAAYELCDDLLSLRFLMLLSYDRAMGDADEITLAEQLGCTEEEFLSIVASLREKGLLEPEKKLKPSASTKNLTGDEMASVIDGSDGMKQLLEECQALCGKVFTPTDVSKIVALRKELGLDCETILLLFFYYFEKLDAVGKKLSVSYVEKSAYGLYNQGIRTADALQAYIEEVEMHNSNQYRLRKLFGMGDRAFTKKEKGFFEKWLGEWAMPFELVQHAFDLTVDKTGKPGLEYMSKILSDWHDSGITTVEQAEKASAEYRSSSNYKTKFKEAVKEEETPSSSFNTDEFFEKALKRSYAMMNGKDGEA
jgi:DnaD/phage-associated family protein